MHVRFHSCVTFLLAIVLIVPVTGSANHRDIIKGRVVDSESGRGLSGASIVVRGTHNTASMSRTDGSFAFPLPEGAYTIRFTHIGMDTSILRRIVGRHSENKLIIIQLTPIVLRLGEVVTTASAYRVRNVSVRTARSCGSYCSSLETKDASACCQPGQAFPNPTRGKAGWSYAFRIDSSAAEVRFELVDVSGQSLWRIHRRCAFGWHRVFIPSKDLRPGVFLLRFSGNSSPRTAKLMLLR